MRAGTSSRFYRQWSSRAAEVALTSRDRRIQLRCAHSANIWALIADAIEGGDERGFRRLTQNLICLPQGR